MQELLQTSIEYYSEILARLERMGRYLPENRTEGLLEELFSLREMEEKAHQVDARMLEALKAGEWLVEDLGKLMEERQHLLEQVAGHNRDLLEKTLVHRAMVAAELGDLQGNRVAMSGYRSGQDRRGGIVSGAY